MRRTVSATFAALAIALVPAAVSAQIGIAAKAGTTGVGGDIAFAVTDNVNIRGGFGFVPADVSFQAGDIDYDFTAPTFFTAGVDFYPAGAFRLMAGALLRSGDYEVEGTASGTYEIGDQTYTEEGTIFGNVSNSELAPFVGIGFGKHTGGFGLFLDLGVAFTGDPTVELDASQNLKDQPGFQAELEREEAKIQADLRGEGSGEYVDLPFSLNYWPFIQFGVKFSVGG